MKKSFLILLLTLFAGTIFAQDAIDPNAKAILDKAVQTLQKSAGITADFQITMEAGQSEQKQTINGSLWLKGNKFRLAIPGVETYFDGTTQWVYMTEAKEVTISHPTEAELQEINPTTILTSYKKGYKIEGDAEKQEKGKTILEINLYPTDLKKDFFRINLKIEKDTHNLVAIKTYDKSGSSTNIVLTKYEAAPLDDTVFTFQSAAGIDEIDLR
ncbi:MAG: outer membrane lipoprotein carrier protein LolA [Prevotellaceae bacterium]|jgi:outer membrane lipoprotein-sorting protein|nr:outer membrane lipoprotein carrier protein LolA [Prevotellaceae bacterium]